MTPAEPTIPVGMKAWAGGTYAPDDWRECDAVLARNGQVLDGLLSDEVNWSWNAIGAEWDCIAYTPRTPEPTGDTREQVAREVAHRIAREFRSGGWPAKEDELARLLLRTFDRVALAALPPARDAEVERMREALVPIVAHFDKVMGEPSAAALDPRISDDDAITIKVGDLRRARAALSASDGKEGVS